MYDLWYFDQTMSKIEKTLEAVNSFPGDENAIF